MSIRSSIHIFILSLSIAQAGNRGENSVEFEERELSAQGIQVRYMDPSTVELTDVQSGARRIKTLDEPTLQQIQAWADTHDIPILEIDPTQIDTSQFTGWFTFWTEVPLSNGVIRPLVIGDVDHDNNVEFYGQYKDSTMVTPESRAYEVDVSGNNTLFVDYFPRSVTE